MPAVVTRNAGRVGFVGAALFVIVGVLMLAVIGALIQHEQEQQQSCGVGLVGGAPTAAANAIPSELMAIYRAAERRYGVAWNVLAAINSVETDFGRNMHTSSAGAVGWMQFMPATWARYGVDGNGDGREDPSEPEDAIPAAANYLRALGAQHNLHDAIYGYNHAEWYVQQVLALARSYAQGNFATASDTTTGADGGGLRTAGYPLARRGPVSATAADHRARARGNWQSDNAIDIAVPAGTEVLAVEAATVEKTGGSPSVHDFDATGGYSVTLATKDNRVFYAHLTRALVRVGEHVKTGQVIGRSGYANNVDHLHIAVQNGDPMALWGARAATAEAIGGDCTAGALGPAELDRAVTLDAPRAFALLPAWAMAGGRAPEQVDARIFADVAWVLRTYGLRVSAAREAGHHTHGDGTAVDMVPAHDTSQSVWDSTALRLAHDVGWIESCGASGAAPACPLKPWVRFVAYNGYPNHGDPAHAGAMAHLHVSWYASAYGASALAPPSAWVRVFAVPAATEVGPR